MLANLKRPLRLSELQGNAEQRAEPYRKYGEVVAEALTQQFAKSASGVAGSAGQQASTAERTA